MRNCGFYQEHVRQLQSREIRGDRQTPPSQRIVLPWCGHPKHSPATEARVTTVIGGNRLLTCGGDLAQCQIAAGLINDL